MKETKDKLLCSGHSIDQVSIEELKKNLDSEEGIYPLSRMFKALSDPTRLKIIYVLAKSALCVCDIATILDMSQSAISHQLRTLRDIKLVKFRREGKLIIYSLDDEHVLELFKQGLNHVNHR